jgi:hypothetical protein
MNKCKGYSKMLFLAVLMISVLGLSASSIAWSGRTFQAAPSLGTAQSFAVLGGPAVTLTNSMVIGDVGVALSTAFTNTESLIAGDIHAGDVVAAQAYNDFLSASNALAAKQCDVVLTGTLAGETLAPGVYCFDAAATLTGQLILAGPSNGIWIFKIGAGALTGTSFSVVMANGGQVNNVYWQVAQAVTMTDSEFKGTILAGAAITMTRGTFVGHALAEAAVTLTGVSVYKP